MPRTKRGRPPAPAPPGRDLEAEWQHLRAWLQQQERAELLTWNMQAIADRVGLSRPQVKALLRPSAAASDTRTAATVLRLENFQRLFSAPAFGGYQPPTFGGYQPPTNHYLFL